MKAILCHAFGPIDTLRYEDTDDPLCGPGQVLIEVMAAGVNFPDALLVRGEYQSKPPLPFIPGSEVAGFVKALGVGVQGLSVGDRVAAFCGTGGYATQAVVPASHVFPLPAQVPFTTAAGMVVTYGTSYHALKDRAQLCSGERLLVLGAAGGVGLAAVELGKHLGATVVAAASTPAKLAIATAHGADDVLDYSTVDLRTELKRRFAKGIDVVVDPVGGDFSEAALRSLAWAGRYLVVGFTAGRIPAIPSNLLLLKSAALLGVLWGATLKADPIQQAANLQILFSLVANGSLTPFIESVQPLSEAPTVLTRLMSRQVTGKIVLSMSA
jgi:NADPH2:quinone reductase